MKGFYGNWTKTGLLPPAMLLAGFVGPRHASRRWVTLIWSIGSGCESPTLRCENWLTQESRPELVSLLRHWTTNYQNPLGPLPKLGFPTPEEESELTAPLHANHRIRRRLIDRLAESTDEPKDGSSHKCMHDSEMISPIHASA